MLQAATESTQAVLEHFEFMEDALKNRSGLFGIAAEDPGETNQDLYAQRLRDMGIRTPLAFMIQRLCDVLRRQLRPSLQSLSGDPSAATARRLAFLFARDAGARLRHWSGHRS